MCRGGSSPSPRALSQQRHSALRRAYAAQCQNPSPQNRCRRVSTARRAIKSSWNLEVANQQFEQLCDRFANFIAELRKKRQYYLAFLNYPESIRRSVSTTNVVEAVNGQLEIMCRNSGGYFHSEDVLKLKLGLAVSSLE
ncbi:MAG: transposase [Terriglobales bacterium]